MKSWIKKINIIYRGILFIEKIEHGIMMTHIFNSVIQAVTPFINLFMLSYIIDAITNKKPLYILLLYVFVMVGLNAIIRVVSSLMETLIKKKDMQFNLRYDMAVANKMMSMHYETLDTAETHNLRMRISEASNIFGSRIQKILMLFPGMAQAVFTVIFSTALTINLFFNMPEKNMPGIWNIINTPVFTIALLILIVLTILVNMNLTAKSTKKMMNQYDLYIPVNKVGDFYSTQYLDSYHAGKDIRLYNQKNIIIDELEQNNRNCFKIDNETAKIEYKYANINSFISTFINILVYIFVGLKAWVGALSVGNIVKYVGSFNEFISGFTRLMNSSSALLSNNQYIEQTLEFMSIDDAIFKGILPVTPNTNENAEKYEIKFENVSFKYPDSDRYILKNINITLEYGHSLAIVGENGSGKTTFVKLLCGLYKPTEGKITLNGKDIYDYKYDEYLKLFSVVFQDFKLLSFQLGNNIAVGEQYDSSKIREAIGKAGFEKRFESLEDGADTYLYNDFDLNGVEISGGEAQKIAIARALYKDAEIIVLDEPTASLDPIAENEIYSNFNEIMHGKTTICISHRLSSCKFCEKICVFDNGEIVQYDSHENLVKNTGEKYYELWNAQAQYYKNIA
ncbi:MAG: ABC transporter ATP-binding protein/permease [Oscillospiraceae bacterium]|nr:ABC transporter ATP-binding protein/permease [Oscillospiraceae bacterium]